MSQRTKATKLKEIKRSWHVFDAEDKVLGRLAAEVSRFLVGKDKVYYSPHLDCGDFVVVINAEKVKVTGNKEVDKVYYRHSGYPGGFKQERLEDLRARRPEEIVRRAVSGMLPKNRLRARRLRRLRVFRGPTHPYQSQVSSGGF